MSEKPQELYDYWRSIPALKFINAPKKVYEQQPIRRAIIKILREGLQENSKKQIDRKRHALNVIEIKQLLNDKENIEISQTNLYFHLNTLEESGFIQVATILHEGPHKRNKTKYFGRVARHLYVLDQEESSAKYRGRFQEFEKLAKLLNINLPKDFLVLAEDYQRIREKHYAMIANWLAKHEIIIDENNLNDSELFEFLKFIDYFDEEYITILGDISKNLKREMNKHQY